MHRLPLTAALALALTGSVALAQTAQEPQQQAPPAQQQGAPMHHFRHGRGMHHDPHRQVEMISKRLNLNPDQSAKLEPILAARDQKMSALRADTSLTPEARRAQFKAIHEETKQQFASVLTPDQLNQMKSLRHGRGMHRQGPPPAGPAGV
ncbi:MAG TPA: hypothetical protein VGN16_07925 [Acidobacteriaceae bacterium]|jgi:Spy/CpxP family protein refolding chaperone